VQVSRHEAAWCECVDLVKLVIELSKYAAHSVVCPLQLLEEELMFAHIAHFHGKTLVSYISFM
jgi:hypothetical protein